MCLGNDFFQPAGHCRECFLTLAQGKIGRTAARYALAAPRLVPLALPGALPAAVHGFGGPMQGQAFNRALRYLSYLPAAKWTALVASIAAGVFFVLLLALLALFADLIVNRGAIPMY